MITTVAAGVLPVPYPSIKPAPLPSFTHELEPTIELVILELEPKVEIVILELPASTLHPDLPNSHDVPPEAPTVIEHEPETELEKHETQLPAELEPQEIGSSDHPEPLALHYVPPETQILVENDFPAETEKPQTEFPPHHGTHNAHLSPILDVPELRLPAALEIPENDLKVDTVTPSLLYVAPAVPNSH